VIDALALLPGQVQRPADGKADKPDAAELFARVLATEVRKAMPDEAMGGEYADVFGPMLDDVLAEQLADDLRASLPAHLRGDALARPVAAPSTGPRWHSVSRSGHDHDDVRVTSGFGMRVHPMTGRSAHHDGVDISAPRGTAIPVARPGVVIRAEKAGGYGNVVVVDHGDGVQTRYAHCDRLDVTPGQRVEAGDVLGTVGSTGRSTGPHLHFEVRIEGRAVDPSKSGYADLFPQLGGG
jgi:murein DD-endopeptidase MepM/ murein hydrolase activator NlpD